MDISFMGYAMKSANIQLGRIYGIKIGVDYSWFVVFVLITMSLSTQYATLHPQWSPTTHVLVGIVTSLLFFVTVLLHEMGHSVVAIQKGIPVRSITLFIFGGVAQIAREPKRAVDEFWIAVAGPVVSFVIAIACMLGSVAMKPISGVANAVLTWLGQINLVLALFNLIPGFPLDGGRILRAILWGWKGDFKSATRTASGVGQFVAYSFIFAGVITALRGNFFNGLWIGFIGWFLLNAAQTSYRHAALKQSLAGLTVRDVMSTDCPVVSGSIPLSEFVHDEVLRTGQRCFLVTQFDKLVGIITLHEVKQIPQAEWNSTPVATAMQPLDHLHMVHPSDPLVGILEKMTTEGFNQLPVVEEEKLVGILGRDRLLQLIQTRLELG
ncbi:MAG: site-2 protease family protein [Acidobacteriia bacterium]|nr:site-2 protease family protein [Terriglobia bacterium]